MVLKAKIYLAKIFPKRKLLKSPRKKFPKVVIRQGSHRGQTQRGGVTWKPSIGGGREVSPAFPAQQNKDIHTENEKIKIKNEKNKTKK